MARNYEAERVSGAVLGCLQVLAAQSPPNLVSKPDAAEQFEGG